MIEFGTKAETLKNILNAEIDIGAEILPLYLFDVGRWRQDREGVWADIAALGWERTPLIVRSSARNEDTKTSSMAGKYASLEGIAGKDAFIRAADWVIASYGAPEADDQALVQPMLQDVALCGVAFTVDPNTGGRYYVLNYDDSTGSTSSVTSGTGKSAKLFYCFKGDRQLQDPFLQSICNCLAKLEAAFQSETLDVEFALDRKGRLYIFQVRPLCMRVRLADFSMQKENLARIAEKIRRENRAKPFLYGKRTIFGVMPDWNPAEMIGIRPKSLALSLYKEMITDNVWAYQRHNYGYKNLRSFPLMVDFCGLPYIDVRISFNSFLPGDLRPELAEKLINYYLDRLMESPYKHDKVEFEIIFSCYTLDLPERIQILSRYGFEQSEIQEILDALKALTNQITNSKTGLWRKDAQKLDVLESRRRDVMESDLNRVDKIYWLLEDCKRYGTLPFAGLARAAFIAMQILSSLVSKKIISTAEYQAFLNDLTTVSSAMKHDFDHLSQNAFLHKYGHLRPGTYDITSPRYDQTPELYFDWNGRDDRETGGQAEGVHFKLSLAQLKRIRGELLAHGLDEDVLGLFEFIRRAIEGREYAKFVFTKNLSDILLLFGELGRAHRISIEDCAFCNIQIIKDLYQTSMDVKETMENSIRQGKARYEEAKTICLPPLILNERDSMQFFVPDTEPTYVTLKKASGKAILVNGKFDEEIAGCILMIPSADPGFDWIFSHRINGFVTEYGGANSHMAIRACELGIPAVIGAGTKLFERLKKARTIEIDAALKKVGAL